MTTLQERRGSNVISNQVQRELPPDLSSVRHNLREPLKPFFLMDWLEEWTQDYDLYQLAAMLKTPPKSDSREEDNSTNMASFASGIDPLEPPLTPKSSNRRCHKALSGWASCPAFNTRSSSISPLRPSQLSYKDRRSSVTDMSDQKHSYCHQYAADGDHTIKRRGSKSPHSIYRKSIARGNAWNSKGLKKASEGQWLDALACWENALEIRKHLLGPHHVDVASTLNNQGIAYGKMGLYGEAIESLNQALKIRTELWKTKPSTTLSDCTSVLSTLHNLSNVHQQADNWEEALQVLEDARKIGNIHSAPNLPRARIAVAMGHLLWMAPDPTNSRTNSNMIRAKEALQEARMLLADERQHQQHQLVQGNRSDDELVSAILTTQQELLDVDRDLKEIGAALRDGYTTTLVA